MKRILAMDDDTAILRCLRIDIGRVRLQGFTTENPLETVDRLVREVPGLIILDVLLPQKGGLFLGGFQDARS